MVIAERSPAGPSLDTIERALDTIDKGNVVDLAAIIPLKNRTATSFSTCSVATEQGVTDSRDVAASETRGVDGSREGVDDASIVTMGTCEGTILSPTAPERLGSVACASSPEQKKAVPSNDSNSVGRSGYCCSPISILIGAGNNIDSAIQHFYSSVEIGAEKVFCLTPKQDIQTSKDAAPTAADLLAASGDADDMKSKALERQPSIKTAKSEGTIKTQFTNHTTKTTKTECTLNTLKEEPEEGVEVQTKPRSSCCLLTVFTCSGGEKEEEVKQAKEAKDLGGSPRSLNLGGSPRNLNDIIGDTLDITTSSDVHILDTFSDDNTYNTQKSLDYVTPKAHNLLSEIEDMEDNFHEVRMSASFSKEKLKEIKKRQDPYIQKMASIKQTLLEQQALLQLAPEDTKKDFYRAISRAAILNAEVDTRRAELELKKIRLESMKVEDEMDRMMGHDGTFDGSIDDDTMNDTIMSKESEEGLQRAFDAFARYTTNEFNKLQRTKTHKDQSARARW